MMSTQLCVLTGCLGLLLAPVAPAQTDSVRINEVLAKNVSHTNLDGRVTDWIELFNTNVVTVALAGYAMSDTNAIRYTFPTGATIAARGFLLLSCDTNQPASISNIPFGLSAAGGYVYLYAPSNTVTPVDALHYGLQVEDASLGRVPDGTGTFTLCSVTMRGSNVAETLGQPGSLRINEWMADAGGATADWFELYNATNKPVALGGLVLADTNPAVTRYTVPAFSYIGSGYVRGYRRFLSDGVTSAYTADHVSFTLSKSVERLNLFGTNGTTLIDSVGFTGQTARVSQGRLPDGGTNIVLFPTIGNNESASPGAANSLVMTNLVVNELLSHTDPPQEDAVEFLNTGVTSVDISGWWISNSKSDPQRARIPPGPAIPPGGLRVIYEYQFNTNAANYPAGYARSNIINSFTFNAAHGDEVHLFAVDTNGALTGLRCSEVFEAAFNGVSFERHHTSVPGDYKFVAAMQVTLGTNPAPATLSEFRSGAGLSNGPPLVGPIVINEIMFAPSPTLWGTNTTPKENPDEEYVELLNITTNAVPLHLVDPAHPASETNGWIFQTAVSYVFPATASLGPTSSCLVVGFDPLTNATALAGLRARYAVSTNVPVFGPWVGRLSGAGDAVELYRPDFVQQPPHPDAGFVPYIRGDKVNYETNAPWPAAANNTGLSLQRISPVLFGNDPANWTSAAPSPGSANDPAFRDSDGDGMADAWEIANGLNAAYPGDAYGDLDADGLVNLTEFHLGTKANSSDSDNDGAPDAWEVTNGLNPVIDDGALDADGDRFSNVEEYIAGTEPTNAASFFARAAWNASPSNNPVVQILVVASRTGRTYRVQSSTNLLGAGTIWSALGSSQPGSGGNLIFIVTNDVPGRMYRTGVSLP